MLYLDAEFGLERDLYDLILEELLERQDDRERRWLKNLEVIVANGVAKAFKG